MRFFVALIVCAALIAGCGENDEQAGTPATLANLVVEVDPDGADAKEPKTATVQCDAPEDSELCKAVDALDTEVFEPTPGNVACTQQYGGPETATVTGTFKGEQVDAEFGRQNGCEIARWEDAAPLLEAAR
jgi:hypothetical protein